MFKKGRHILILLLAAASPGVASCDVWNSLFAPADGDPVARVGERVLTRQQLESYLPDGLPFEDSVALSAQYIRSWASEQLYVSVAESQLSAQELDVSAELEQYRRSLLKYRYEQRYVSERLDTLVTEAQIAEYYERHKSAFTLTQPVLKVRFVDLLKDSPNVKVILKMIASDEYSDVELADSLARSSAMRFFDMSDRWIDATSLAKEFGTDAETMLSHLTGNTIRLESEEDGSLKVAHVVDICKSGPAPVDYCAEHISELILSARKHSLLQTLEQSLLDDALAQEKYVIYDEHESD